MLETPTLHLGSPEPGPPPPERSQTGFAILLAVFLAVAFVFLGAPVQALHPAYGIWFTEIFVFFGLTWMALRLSGRHPIHYPRLGVPAPAAMGMGFVAGAVNFIALVIPLQALSQAVMPDAWVEFFDMSKIFEQLKPMELAWMIAGVSVAAPVCEEYFFRGVLLRGLVRDRAPIGWALVISAFVFSAFHIDPVGLLARFELGLLFGFLFLRTGSLWPAVMAHAANNIVSSAIYFAVSAYYGEAEADAEPELAAVGLMLLIAGPPLYMVIRWFQARTPMLPTGDDHSSPGLRFKELGAFFAALVLSFGLVAALDWRTMAVNVADMVTPLRDKAQREELESLRDAARTGDVPVREYYRERERLAKRRGAPDAADAPETPAPVPAPPDAL